MTPRVLLISYEPVDARMAGLAIRYAELARVLAHVADVTLASPAYEPFVEGVETVAFRPHAPYPLREAIRRADVVVTHPHWPLTTRWMARSDARLIYDLYDPETLGALALFAGRRLPQRRLMAHLTLDRLHDALATGHHFMCASEKQRDLWLGTMVGQRRIDPRVYERDPSLRSVIDTVPFGVPAQPPVAGTGLGPRERFAGIGADAELVLWNGGIWNWLDPPLAVEAVAELVRRRPRVRLVFMGVAARQAGDEATERTRRRAAELGVLNRVVFFNKEWVPYAERGTWLAQADCAISAHPEHLETRFAFRTRLLDCFWAELPIVCTAGDALGERVQREGLGATAPAGDVHALTLALEQVLERGRQAHAPALRRAAEEHAWPRVAQPLVRWIADTPRPARRGPTPGEVGRTLGHRTRAAAYLLAGRRVLDRHGSGAARRS